MMRFVRFYDTGSYDKNDNYIPNRAEQQYESWFGKMKDLVEVIGFSPMREGVLVSYKDKEPAE